MNSVSHLIHAGGISFSYDGKAIFSHIDFILNEGDIYLIYGPSGVGKTTLLTLLGGIIEPQSGMIRYDDSLLPREIGFGYAFIDGPFFELLSVKENILILESFLNIRIDREYYRELLEYFEIDSFETTSIISLSSGQRERVNFIRALVHKPKVVIFDEPGSNLDSRLFKKFVDFIKMKSMKNHTSFIIVSHDNSFSEIATRTLELTQP